MKKLSIPVAMAASVFALTCATSSFADDTEVTSTTTSTTTTPTTTTTQPATQPTYVQPAPVIVQPASTTTTTAAPYYPPGGDTTERTVEKRPNRTLLSTGVGIFVVSYGASAVAGAISDRDSDKNLFIPVVGPWMDLADRNCGAADPCGNREDINKAMIITSGVVQGVGVLMALSSLIIPETTSVRETRSAKAKPSVAVAPVSFGTGAGLGAVGRF